MSELRDAIRFIADHVFRDQSADSVAKRAALEEILSPGGESEPANQPADSGQNSPPAEPEGQAGESAAPAPTATEENAQASGLGNAEDASPADAPVNPQVLPTSGE